jgi:hypothetical protein
VKLRQKLKNGRYSTSTRCRWPSALHSVNSRMLQSRLTALQRNAGCRTNAWMPAGQQKDGCRRHCSVPDEWQPERAASRHTATGCPSRRRISGRHCNSLPTAWPSATEAAATHPKADPSQRQEHYLPLLSRVFNKKDVLLQFCQQLPFL